MKLKSLNEKLSAGFPITKFYWSKQQGIVIDPYSGNLRPEVTLNYGENIKDWNNTIISPLQLIDKCIRQNTLYTGVNFIAGNKESISVLSDCKVFFINESLKQDKPFEECEYYGNLSNHIKIYEFNNPKNELIVGYYSIDGIKVIMKDSRTIYTVEHVPTKVSDINLVNNLGEYCILEIM